jgi:hypothetical protein
MKLLNKYILSAAFTAALMLSSGNVVFASSPSDEFSYTNQEDAMLRLDRFMVELHNDPASTGVIIVYGPKLSKRGEIEARIKDMPAYFRFRGFDLARITFVNGGYRDNDRVYIVLWRVPAGAKNPVPTGTLDRKEVKIKGVFRHKVRLYNG